MSACECVRECVCGFVCVVLRVVLNITGTAKVQILYSASGLEPGLSLLAVFTIG